MPIDGGAMLLMGLVGLAIVVYGMHQRSREADALREAATRLRVAFVAGSGVFGGGERSFEGELDGVRFRVRSYEEGSGDHTERRIRISAHGVPLNLSVRRQGAFEGGLSGAVTVATEAEAARGNLSMKEPDHGV